MQSRSSVPSYTRRRSGVERQQGAGGGAADRGGITIKNLPLIVLNASPHSSKGSTRSSQCSAEVTPVRQQG